MSVYTVSRSNVTPSAGQDIFTVSSASGRRVKLKYISAKSMGTVAAANELIVSRSSGGATGGGALTPQKQDPDAPASAFTVETTWGTQPTLDSGTPHRLSFPGNGGMDQMYWAPGDEIVERNGGRISVRQGIGTSTPVSVMAIIEEI